MKIKRYVADDLPQAVAAIRRELGREAVILSTRRLPRAGWRRLFRRFDRVEVAAAVEESRMPAASPTGAPPAPQGGGLAPATGVSGGAQPQEPAPEAGPPATATGWSGAFVAAAEAVRPAGPATLMPAGVAVGQAQAAMAADPAVSPGAQPGPGPGNPEADAAPASVRSLDLVEPAASQSDLLRHALLRPELAPPSMGAPEPIRVRPGTRRLVALVGPTGAGKTTTLAKLAAHLHLQQGWRVALITADTFRVGAVEQLAAYARLLGVPMEVTPTPAALERALQRVQQMDIVLIDTSGRGHHDARRMQELRGYLQVAREVAGGASPETANAAPTTEAPPPVGGTGGDVPLAPGGLEVHLVLAAATRRAEVEGVVTAYRSVIDRMLITKLDECESTPEVVAVAAAAGVPLSYCCAGQRVPEDLALAWPDRVAAGLFGGASGPPALRTG